MSNIFIQELANISNAEANKQQNARLQDAAESSNKYRPEALKLREYIRGTNRDNFSAEQTLPNELEHLKEKQSTFDSDGILGNLQNFGVSTMEAAVNVVAGGSKLFTDSDTAEALRGFTESIGELRTEAGKVNRDGLAKNRDIYNTEVMHGIARGDITQTQGETMMAINTLKTIDFNEAVDLFGSVTGSVLPTVALAAFGGVGVAAGMGLSGASALAEAVDQIDAELFAQKPDGSFEYSHDLLYESSPVYKAAIDGGALEYDARNAVRDAIRADSLSSAETLGGTALEVLGEVGLLTLTGVMGKATGAAKKGLTGAKTTKKGMVANFLKGTGSGMLGEGVGNVGRLVGTNKALREIDEDRSAIEGIHENTLDVVAAVGSVPAVKASQVAVGTAKVLGSTIRRNKKADEAKAVQGTVTTPESFKAASAAAADVLAQQQAERQEQAPKSENGEPVDNRTPEEKEFEDVLNKVISNTQERDMSNLPPVIKKYMDDSVKTPHDVITKIGEIGLEGIAEEDQPTVLAAFQGYAQNLKAQMDYLTDNIELAGDNETLLNYIESAHELAKNALSDEDLQKYSAKITKAVKSKEVAKNEDGTLTPEGVQTVKDKLALAPETLANDDVLLNNYNPDDFTGDENAKLSKIVEFLENAKAIKEAQGGNYDIDVVGREVMTDTEAGSKGYSVLAQVYDVMDLVGNNDYRGAKIRMANMARFIRSHKNKLNAMRTMVKENKTSMQYDSFIAETGAATRGVVKVPEKGNVKTLDDTVSAELAFMQEAYNSLVDVYGTSIGNIIDLSDLVKSPEYQKAKAKRAVKPTDPVSRKDGVAAKVTQPNAETTINTNVAEELTNQQLEDIVAEYENDHSSTGRYRHRIATAELARRATATRTGDLTQASNDELLARRREIMRVPESQRTEEQKQELAELVAELNIRTKQRTDARRATGNASTQSTSENPAKNSTVAPEKAIETAQDEVAPQEPDTLSEAGPATETGLDPSNQFADLNPQKSSDIRDAIRSYLRGSKDFFDSVELSDFLNTVEPALLKDEISNLIDTMSRGADPAYITDLKNRITDDPVGVVNEMSEILGERSKQRTLFDTQGEPTRTAVQPVAQEAQPEVPVVAPETVSPVEPTKPLTEKQKLVQAITEAIEANGDNVREVTFGKHTNKYVMLDGVIYNKDGKTMIHNKLLNAFGLTEETAETAVAEVEPDVVDAEPEVETDDAAKARAKELTTKLGVGKHVKFVANKSKIFMKDFVKDLITSLSSTRGTVNERRHQVTYADNFRKIHKLLVSQDGLIHDLAKSRDSIMDNLMITHLANSYNKAAREAIKPFIEEALGKTLSDAELVAYIQENFPETVPTKTVGKNGKERNMSGAEKEKARRDLTDVQRARMQEIIGADKWPEFAFEYARHLPTHGYLNLLEQNADGKWVFPTEVVNALALAVGEMTSNYSTYASNYTKVEDFEQAFGVTGTVEYSDGAGNYISEPTSAASRRGIVTAEIMVNNVSKIMEQLLGVSVDANAGLNAAHSPFNSLVANVISAFSSDNKHNGGLISSFTSTFMKMGNGYDSLVFMTNKDPDSEELASLKHNRSQVLEEVLPEVDRVLHVGKPPKARTKNKQGQPLSQKQVSALEAQVSTPFKPNNRTLQFFVGTLGADGAVKLFGHPDAEDPTVIMNEYDRQAKNGKNIQIRNAISELEAIIQYIEDNNLTGEEAEVYYQAGISSVGRIMMDGGYNPQSDKIVRAVMSPHSQKIDASTFENYLQNGDKEGKTDKFLVLAYGQALGVKIHNNSMENNRKKLNEIFQREGFKDAAKELYRISVGEGSLEGGVEAAITDAQKVIGNLDELTVQTLIEIGEILETGGKDLTTHAYIEADGVTNGPFVAGFLFGIDVSDANWVRFMANSGLYIGEDIDGNTYRQNAQDTRDGQVPDNYGDVANLAGKNMDRNYIDMHENAIDNVITNKNGQTSTQATRRDTQEFLALSKKVLSRVFPHIEVDAGGNIKARRDMAKNPVTVIFYGSGLKGIGNKFMGEVTEFIHELGTAIVQSESFQELADLYIKDPGLTPEERAIEMHNLMYGLELMTQDNVISSRYNTETDVREYFLRGYKGKWKSLFDVKNGQYQVGQYSKKALLANPTKEQFDNFSHNLVALMVEPINEALHETAASTLKATKIVGEATNAFSNLVSTMFGMQLQKIIKADSYSPFHGISRKQLNDIKKLMKSYGVTNEVADHVLDMFSNNVLSIPGSNIRPTLDYSLIGNIDVNRDVRGMGQTGVAGIPRAVISAGDASIITNFMNAASEAVGNAFLQVYDGINLGAKNWESGGQLANDSVMEAMNPRAVANLAAAINQNSVAILEGMFGEALYNRDWLAYNPKELSDIANTMAQAMRDQSGDPSIKPSHFKDVVLGFLVHNFRSATGIELSPQQMTEMLKGNFHENIFDDYTIKRINNAFSNGYTVLPTYIKDAARLRDTHKNLNRISAFGFLESIRENNPHLGDLSEDVLVSKDFVLKGVAIHDNVITTENKDGYIKSNNIPANSLGRLNSLVRKIELDHAVMQTVGFSIDQMAGGGFHSYHEGKKLDTSDYEQIAEALAEARVEVARKRINEKNAEKERLRKKMVADARAEAQERAKGETYKESRGKKLLERFFDSAGKLLGGENAQKAKRLFFTEVAEDFKKDDPRRQLAMYLASRFGKPNDFQIQLGNDSTSHFNTANKTITIGRNVAGRVFDRDAAVHEGLHAVTHEALYDYYTNGGKNLSHTAKVAIRNLETLLSEVLGHPEGFKNTNWANAINHIREAGNLRRRRGEFDLVMADQIGELISTFLTDPKLSAEAVKMPVRSKLRQLADSVIKGILSILGITHSGKMDNLFEAIALNAMAAAGNSTTKKHEAKPSDEGVSLQMFEGDTFGYELEELANRAIERSEDEVIRRHYAATNLTHDTGGEFRSAGFKLSDDDVKRVNDIAITIGAVDKLDPTAMKEMYRQAAHIFRNLKPEHFGDVSNPGSGAYYTAMNKYNAVTGVAAASKKSMVPALVGLTFVNQEMKDVLNKLGGIQAEKSTERNSKFEESFGNFGYRAIHKLNDILNKPINNKSGDVIAETVTQLKKPKGEDKGLMSFPRHLHDKAEGILLDVLGYASKALVGVGERVEGFNKGLGIAISTIGEFISSEGNREAGVTLNNWLGETGAYHQIKDLLRDFVGRTAENADVYDLTKQIRAFVQRARQMFVEGVPNNIRNRFKTEPTAEIEQALYLSLGATDIASVAQDKTADEVLDILTDPKKVQDRTKQLKASIEGAMNGEMLLYKSEQLAHYMVTGETGGNLLTNATYIANLHGEGLSTDPTANLIKQIDEYVSLLAFQKQDNKQFMKMAELEPEAIKYVIATLKGLRADEIEGSGYDTPMGIKGYVPTKTSGSTIIANDKDRKKLENRGYKRVADYVAPAGDITSTPRGYYVSPMEVKQPFAQGIIQNTVRTSNGVDIAGFRHVTPTMHYMKTDPNNMENMLARMRSKIDKYGLVPIYTEDGTMVGVSRALDASILNRESSFFDSLGMWRGRQVEEYTADQFNDITAETLMKNYEQSTNKHTYVNILDARQFKDDKVISEALSVLSPKLKKDAKKKYGKLMVSRDMLTNVIGYRQLSLTELWDDNSKEGFKYQARMGLEAILGPKAYYYVARGEEILTGLVGDAKQLIVVKSVVVPVINILSNMLHMTGRGISPIYWGKAIPKKLAEIEEYSRGVKRLIEIEGDKLAAEGSPAEVRRLDAEATAINEYHRQLSIWPLISNGEFTSIVSAQIDNESGNISKGKVAEYIENQINKLEGGKKTVAKNLMMTRDTSIYQFLQKSVDYGDFIAKAIMYDHLTQVKGKSHSHAIGKVREEFVNYDFLPGRIRGGLERLGLLWFYNYKVRTVKIAGAMIRENPLSVLLASQFPSSTVFGNIDMPTTANFVTQLFNDELKYTTGPGMGLRAPFLHPITTILE